MIDALLLELEGVVVETETLRDAALIGACEARGVAAGEAAVHASRGFPLAARVEQLLGAAGVAEDVTLYDIVVHDASRRFAESLRRAVVLKGGAREFLEAARARARVAVVTRASREEGAIMLERSGVEAFVEFMISSEDAPAKPSPAGYQRALSRLERGRALSSGSVIALEDHPVGVAAARGAGVRCLLVGDAADPSASADARILSLETEDLESLELLLSGERSRSG